MALPQSALSELLDAIRAGGSVDVMREAMTLVLQELIELEATQVIGAARYERTEERMTHHNSSRSSLLSTKAGDVELRIPSLPGRLVPADASRAPTADRPSPLGGRHGGLRPWRVHRKVDELVAVLGIDAGISKSEVSRICAELDAIVAVLRDRPLGHTWFPLVFLDAT
jgi:putative transposase